MAKKDIDWSNIGFGYIKTDYRYVSNFKDGSWDEGTLTTDDMITLNECACVFQYAQTCFEGLKAYTTEDGHIVTFRPDLNAERMMNSAARLEMPQFSKERFIDAVRFRRNSLHPSVYVRYKPGNRCETGIRVPVPCFLYTGRPVLQGRR